MMMMTTVFVRSSSNLEYVTQCGNEDEVYMANNTGSSKRTLASIYFRFSSFLLPRDAMLARY